MSSVAEIVGLILERIIENMELDVSFTSGYSSHSRHFDSSFVPEISIREYLMRIFKYAHCSPSCFVLSFIYIDRLLQNNPGFKLSKRNIHRLALASIILAIKYSDDYYYDNTIYAKIGGVTLNELNVLEAKMSKLLNYSLHVSSNSYAAYINAFEAQAQKITERKSCQDENDYMKDIGEVHKENKQLVES